MITDTDNFKPASIEAEDDVLKMKALLQRYESAKNRRDEWTGLWQDCYDYALPQRGGFNGPLAAGRRARIKSLMVRRWMRRNNSRQVCWGI